MATSIFEVNTFVSSPTWEELDALRKDDLLCVVAHFELNASKQMLKKDFKSLVATTLVEEGLLPSAVLSC